MNSKPDILRRILARKVEEIEAGARKTTLADWRAQLDAAPRPRGFAAAMQARVEAGGPAVIAEVKKASPSAGVLREPFDVAEIAGSYAEYGATCLSVLTDAPFFQGRLENLKLARKACALPLLRKDFIVDPWQVYEARVAGADAILLIVAALGDAMLADLTALAADLDLDVLVEAHDEQELERALALPTPLIGINNRDLHTFATRLETSLELAPLVPKNRLLVTESGVSTAAGVARMREAGIQAFLVGEAFMRAPEPGKQLAKLFGGATGGPNPST